MADEIRDPELSRRYRELSREEPGEHIDAAILAAARRAAETRPAPLVPPTARRRWYFPLAAAAVLVLAVAVTLQVERSEPDLDSLAPPPVQEQKQKVKKQPENRPSAQREMPKTEAFSAPAPSAEPLPPVNKAHEAARAEQAPSAAADVAGKRDMTSERQNAAGAAASAPSAAAAPPVAAEMRPQLQARALAKVESPEQALERIAQLRREGRDEEADKALAEFRKRYPDFRIPDEMLKKVERR